MASRKTIWTLASASVALAALSALSANATPQFAKDTGKACAACHQNPKGGVQLTPMGTQFKVDGNKMPVKSDEKPPEKATP